MTAKLDQFKALAAEISDLNAATALLGWDQQTYMPKGGAEDRSDALATLSRLAHLKSTSPEIGELLAAVQPEVANLDPDSDDARLVKISKKQYEKQVKVSPEWVSDFAKMTALGHSAWEEARRQSNFALFQPHLEKIVGLRRDYARFFAPFDHVYDPLLDDFEPGMKTAEVQAIFNQVRPVQVAIIQAIRSKTQVDAAFLKLAYDEKSQWDFGVDVITRFGYDWDHGRQDRSAHPFTQGFGIGDVRITTRFDTTRVATALFGTMHEAGHALYEQGIDRGLRRTPLAGGASMALHESQSRMWENLVGRSLSFWKYAYPRFQALFPAQVGGVDLATFYRGINRVEPSLIRVEADEATYNLHIMLRLELEIALMEGSLAVKDLPDAWNQKVQEYLGIRPPNDAVGVLQDVHWSGGMLGYFPTYALGNLVSAQLWEVIQRDIPNLNARIEQGDFAELLAWLREHVHRYGAKFEPQELVQKVTGSKIDPQPYLRYLQAKFGEIYHL
jgi:carboxypeptidase Taq